jgi:hypothetical protein
MVTDSENGFPSGNWIGADYGMDGGQCVTDILRRAARLRVELEVVLGSGPIEFRLGICGG